MDMQDRLKATPRNYVVSFGMIVILLAIFLVSGIPIAFGVDVTTKVDIPPDLFRVASIVTAVLFYGSGALLIFFAVVGAAFTNAWIVKSDERRVPKKHNKKSSPLILRRKSDVEKAAEAVQRDHG